MSDPASLRFVFARNLNLDRPIPGFAALPPASLRRRAVQASRDSFARVVDVAVEVHATFVLISGLVCDPWEGGVSAANYFRQQCQKLAEAGIAVVWIRSIDRQSSGSARPWPAFLSLSNNVQCIDLTSDSTRVVVEGCPEICLVKLNSIEAQSAAAFVNASPDCVTIAMAEASPQTSSVATEKQSAFDIVLELGASADNCGGTCEIITRTDTNEWQTEFVDTRAVRFQTIEVDGHRTAQDLAERLAARISTVAWAHCPERSRDNGPALRDVSNCELPHDHRSDAANRLNCIDVVIDSAVHLDPQSSDALIDELRNLIERDHPSVWINSLKSGARSQRITSRADLFEEVLNRFSADDTRSLESTLVSDVGIDRATLDSLRLDWDGVQVSAVSQAQACIHIADAKLGSEITPQP
ncbi:MAG: hypothetical protein O3A00_12035 [Planctomycetota bacterium]|nr:hypothetical protein [Planctomycetota bacterium]